MKHASILAAITLSCACNAAEVVLEEKFEEVSDNFVKNVYFNTRRSVVENVPGFSSGENSLVADFTDVKTGYPMVIKYPKTGTLNTDGCIYKISFDYKILSYNGTQLCVAAIQRHDGQQIINDDASYFGGKTGQKGKITLYSAAAKLNADPMFFISTRDTADNLSNPEGAVDKPIIVGEYHFCNLDAGVFGGGLRPYRTMKDRIKANNNYVNSALDNPRIVGVHWFRWSDQIASGRDNDGENFCSGLVDICDTPVYEFVDSLRELAKNMYNRRLNGAAN